MVIINGDAIKFKFKTVHAQRQLCVHKGNIVHAHLKKEAYQPRNTKIHSSRRITFFWRKMVSHYASLFFFSSLLCTIHSINHYFFSSLLSFPLLAPFLSFSIMYHFLPPSLSPLCFPCIYCTLFHIPSIYLQGGATALYIASQNGYLEVVKLLVEGGADVSIHIKVL